MNRRRTVRTATTNRIRRESDPTPLLYCLMSIVCGIALVVGLFWAGRQHFSAMDFGIRNAKLRKEKESLEAEQRRLYLHREVAMAPHEIKKAARKIGFGDISSENIQVIGAAEHQPELARSASPQPVNTIRSFSQSKDTHAVPEVKKTVSSIPNTEVAKRIEKPKTATEARMKTTVPQEMTARLQLAKR